MGASTAGYCVGNLLVEGYEAAWEDSSEPYPESLASPLQVTLALMIPFFLQARPHFYCARQARLRSLMTHTSCIKGFGDSLKQPTVNLKLYRVSSVILKACWKSKVA